MRPKSLPATPKPYLPVVRDRDPDLFWRKVARAGDDDCWFVKSASPPEFHLSFTFRRVSYAYHRYSWALHNGVEPGAAVIRHTCDNPHCVNPRHLMPGTTAENNADTSQRRIKGQKKLRTRPWKKWDSAQSP